MSERASESTPDSSLTGETPAWLQVAPFAAVFVVFFLVPLALTVMVSFWDYTEYEIVPAFTLRSYLEMYPVSECGQGQGTDEATADDGGGLGTGAVVGVGVATLAAVGAVAGILIHRRSTADERE